MAGKKRTPARKRNPPENARENRADVRRGVKELSKESMETDMRKKGK